jgi:hypothetical protein
MLFWGGGGTNMRSASAGSTAALDFISRTFSLNRSQNPSCHSAVKWYLTHAKKNGTKTGAGR